MARSRSAPFFILAVALIVAYVAPFQIQRKREHQIPRWPNRLNEAFQVGPSKHVDFGVRSTPSPVEMLSKRKRRRNKHYRNGILRGRESESDDNNIFSGYPTQRTLDIEVDSFSSRHVRISKVNYSALFGSLTAASILLAIPFIVNIDSHSGSPLLLSMASAADDSTAGIIATATVGEDVSAAVSKAVESVVDITSINIDSKSNAIESKSIADSLQRSIDAVKDAISKVDLTTTTTTGAAQTDAAADVVKNEPVLEVAKSIVEKATDSVSNKAAMSEPLASTVSSPIADPAFVSEKQSATKAILQSKTIPPTETVTVYPVVPETAKTTEVETMNNAVQMTSKEITVTTNSVSTPEPTIVKDVVKTIDEGTKKGLVEAVEDASTRPDSVNFVDDVTNKDVTKSIEAATKASMMKETEAVTKMADDVTKNAVAIDVVKSEGSEIQSTITSTPSSSASSVGEDSNIAKRMITESLKQPATFNDAVAPLQDVTAKSSTESVTAKVLTNPAAAAAATTNAIQQLPLICPTSEKYYDGLQRAISDIVGRNNYGKFGAVTFVDGDKTVSGLEGVLLRVRYESCVAETYFDNSIESFVQDNDKFLTKDSLLPLRDTIETFIAGGIATVATAYTVIGSTNYISENGLNWILPATESVESFLAGSIFAIASTLLAIGTTKALTVLTTFIDFIVGLTSRFVGKFAIDRIQGEPIQIGDIRHAFGGGSQNGEAEIQRLQRQYEKEDTYNIMDASFPELVVLGISGILRNFGEALRVIRDALEKVDVFTSRYILLGTVLYLLIKFLHFRVFPDFP